VTKYIHKVGIHSFYNYSVTKQCVFLKIQEYCIMGKMRPLAALWRGGLYTFDCFQKWRPFLQQSGVPCWYMSFLSQQKLLLRKDLIRKSFNILFSGTAENDQRIHLCISALFRFYSCFCGCFIL